MSGNQFLRDGVPWVPHGVVSTAFNAAPATRGGFFLRAFNNLNAAELADIKGWGADSVRFQVSLPGLDSKNSLYDPSFVADVQKGVMEARAAGLNVIVSVQDEPGSGEPHPTPLPDAATGRVWRELAPLFRNDPGILFEIMNEPQPKPNPANWAAWAETMNSVIRIIRGTGARNVLIADGLNYAQDLEGAPTLDDPLHQVAYADHPYLRRHEGESSSALDLKFGNFAASGTAPVLITEWSTENGGVTHFFCDADTALSALAFLHYIQERGIGLMAMAWDLPNQPGVPMDGRLMQDFHPTPTTYADGAQCTDPRYGPGTLIQTWYRTGKVPNKLL